MILIWLMPVLTYLCLANAQLACTTADRKRGDCRSILECPPLRSAANKPRMTPGEVEFLRRSSCGFEGDIPKVCCATATCTTPEGDQGRCISIFECGHIVKILQYPMLVTAEYKAYVNSTRCESTEGYNVCCGPPPVPPPPQTGPCAPAAAPPDPGTKCCGIDGSEGNKIVGGTATLIDEYPWLAILEKEQRNQTKVLCGGVLISGRYVLTAAHCVVGTLTVGTPAYVRLGDYDITNAGRDCVTISDGGEDCTDEPVVIPIELVIPHPDYSYSSPLRRHDIAMLRLKELAPYTDFIRPICLPTRDVTVNIPPTVYLIAAGWGPNNETHSKSDVKLHVYLPYKSIESCQPAYDVPRRRVPLWSGQLCAGGEKGRDTCKGDSGGPLMYAGAASEVVGIVSFGGRPCGLEDIPGVYTKVYEYLPWIRSNIRP